MSFIESTKWGAMPGSVPEEQEMRFPQGQGGFQSWKRTFPPL